MLQYFCCTLYILTKAGKQEKKTRNKQKKKSISQQRNYQTLTTIFHKNNSNNPKVSSGTEKETYLCISVGQFLYTTDIVCSYMHQSVICQ